MKYFKSNVHKKITFLFVNWIEIARSVEVTDYRPTLQKEIKYSNNTEGEVLKRRPTGLFRPATHVNADRKDIRLVGD